MIIAAMWRLVELPAAVMLVCVGVLPLSAQPNVKPRPSLSVDQIVASAMKSVNERPTYSALHPVSVLSPG